MTSGHQPKSIQPSVDNRSYNLFRNRCLPELVCAVPEDCPVPDFIASERWMYAQSLRPQEARPSGFDVQAANAGVRFNGFYLFHAIAAAPAMGAAIEFMLGSL
jgi:hypothetical protein